MKKNLLIIGAALIVLSVACKKEDPIKEYTCTCVVEQTMDGEVLNSATVNTTMSGTKSQVESNCSAGNSTSTSTSGGMTIISKSTCTLN